MIYDGALTSLELCLLPERLRETLALTLGNEDYLAEHTGNALLIPNNELPYAYRGEYPTISGTRIENYTPVLDVFCWQFAREWMGLPAANTAYIAAPRTHVYGALADDIYLVSSPEAIVRAFPDDCNLHWRSFSSIQQSLTTPDQAPFVQLVCLLQQAGVVLPETEHIRSLTDFCQHWSIPLRQQAGSVPRHSLSATTFLWLVPQANNQWMASLGTLFDCAYGFQDE